MVCRGVYRPCCHRDGESLQPLVALGNGNVSALDGQGIVGVDGVISGVELVGACPNTYPVVGGKAVAAWGLHSEGAGAV